MIFAKLKDVTRKFVREKGLQMKNLVIVGVLKNQKLSPFNSCFLSSIFSRVFWLMNIIKVEIPWRV